ncbi:MAG: hypothetical protein ACJ8J0_08430 [Longimicrobiaceae bacterium]
MKKKLSLELEGLSVDSFATADAPEARAGTVQGAEDESGAPEYFDCTCFNTCLCKTAYYYCGDGYQTIYSCNYTHNESCVISAACPTS